MLTCPEALRLLGGWGTANWFAPLGESDEGGGAWGADNGDGAWEGLPLKFVLEAKENTEPEGLALPEVAPIM
jgi:hypothetical protein